MLPEARVSGAADFLLAIAMGLWVVLVWSRAPVPVAA